MNKGLINKNTEKKEHKQLSSLTIGLLALLFISLLLFVGCDSNPQMSLDDRYRDAMALMEAGKYEEAIDAFHSLESYKDSDEQINECLTKIKDKAYDAAVQLMNDEKFEEAIAIFEELNSYKESKAKIDECKYYLSFIFCVSETGDSYAVVGYSGNYEELIIPSEYKSLPITEIGADAFIGRDMVTVTIPDTVTVIGKQAFSNCGSLQLVKLPEYLSVIGDAAFSNCGNLSQITVSKEIKKIGKSAFKECSSLEITYSGSKDEWDNVSKGDAWDSVTEDDGSNSSVFVTFKPICNGVDHYLTIDAAVAPTCESSGLTEGSHCWVCQAIIVPQYVVEAVGHSEVIHNAQEATCTEIGWSEYMTCTRCDYTTYKEISALGHDEINHDARMPTCTEIGWEKYTTCSRCDFTTYSEISAFGHDEISHEAKEATCTENGWEAYKTCSKCDYSTYIEIDALSHNIINHEAREATCSQIGWSAYEECSRCDYTTYSEIPMVNHTLSVYEAKEPNCTEIGWDAYEKCSKCDYTTYNEMKALGHDVVSHDAKKVTCIDVGWDAYETCTRCDYTTYVEIKLDSDAHDVNRENTCILCLEYLDSGVVFTLSDDETYYTVTDYTGDAERVVIPSQYYGIAVTEIGASAFANCSSLTTVVITDNVISICENAFSGCESLVSVNYTGNEEKWANIDVKDESIGNIEIVFDYDYSDVLGEVVFHFIDVGQGDAILITTPWGNMLIDSGDTGSDARNSLVSYLASQGVKSFEYVVFTHPDADHIGSGDYILLNYDVKNVIMPDATKTTQVYKRLIAAIESTDVNLILIGEDTSVCEQYGYIFNIGSMVNTVLAPINDDKDANEMSVVIRTDFGDTSALFTGDAESGSESDMLATYKNGELDCDILKVGHHGSGTSTTDSFLAAVSPEIAVISCGTGNSYGHPHSQVVQRLEKQGIDTYRTDLLGHIVIKTNGKIVEIYLPNVAEEAA